MPRSGMLVGTASATCCVALWSAAALTAAPPEAVDFARDIQPIFAKSCFACHGAEKHEGGLRLHRKTDALAGGDGGAILFPGESKSSKLIAYVTGKNDDGVLMPPAGDGEKLSEAQVALLRAWIDQGAKWPDSAGLADTKNKHWSFQPIGKPAPPSVKNERWVRNGIDSFVLAKLESLGVTPAPEADRATLIRRLCLDLLGLPPSPAEVDAFTADGRPDAYERVVDRLLASPHYGERWGRHWLDMARYADSDGYEKDTARPFAWRWRNWVIDAFNRDLPFDEFSIEQIAGDLLPNATLDQRIATGFHRNTLTNREGGVDQEEYRVKATIDRVNTTGTVWLGLTVGCAQCHSHKYDPLAQREYYGLVAFFNSLAEQDIPAPLPEDLANYERLKADFDLQHAPLAAAVERYERDELPAKLAAWERTTPLQAVEWRALEPVEMKATAAGTKLSKQPDGSALASGKVPNLCDYEFKFQTNVTGITALRVEALADPSLPSSGPGRTAHGNFVLTEVRVVATAANSEKSGGQPVKLENPTADLSQGPDGKEFSPEHAIDGNSKTGWAIGSQYGQSHVAVFEFAEPVGHEGGTTLTVTLEHQFGTKHIIGRPRISVTSASKPVKAIGMSDGAVAALGLPLDKRTPQQQAALIKHFRAIDPELVRLDKAVAESLKNAPRNPGDSVKAQALVELTKPRETHVLIRGDFLRPGAAVQSHTPGMLPPLKSANEKPTRLDFARWIVDPANPLTARVTVNRFWQRYFGRGLAATTDDFGTQGQPPSHPELLDWLAQEFMVRGWSMKELHRLIVSSATYRQSSAARPDLLERDPQNVWLARQGRFRVEAEIVRDLALAASGLLAPQIGGPSVRPPQPAGISELTYANSAKWVESKGADRYRRGLYTHFQRTSPYPMLMTFDAPDSNVCAVRRERSNTPLQALTLLNDAAFVECAQGLAKRTLDAASGDPSSAPVTARLQLAFRLCLARQPTAGELERLHRLYADLLSAGREDSAEAARLAGVVKGDRTDPAEAAAWTAVCRVLLNLDEFVTRE